MEQVSSHYFAAVTINKSYIYGLVAIDSYRLTLLPLIEVLPDVVELDSIPVIRVINYMWCPQSRFQVGLVIICNT